MICVIIIGDIGLYITIKLNLFIQRSRNKRLKPQCCLISAFIIASTKKDGF